MIEFNNKYKKTLAGIILSGYFFLFGYNILHYHQYDVLLQSHVIDFHKDESSSRNNHLVSLDFQCAVHNTYTSLHNLIIQGSGLTSQALYEIELLNFAAQHFHFQKEITLSNSLRAPPSLFS